MVEMSRPSLHSKYTNAVTRHKPHSRLVSRWIAGTNMPLSPLPHEVFVTGHCLASFNQRGANRVTVAPWNTKSVPRMLIASKAGFLENYLAVNATIECHECHDWMPREEASTFQFIWCLIWKPGDSNFWVKIGFALDRSKMSFPPLSPSYNV